MDILGFFDVGGLDEGFFVGGGVDGMSIDGALEVGIDVAVGGLVMGVDVGVADGEGVVGGGRLPDDGQNSSRAGVTCCNSLNNREGLI